MASHISHGADAEQLDDIAVGLRRQSQRIAEVGERGASLVERLRAQWDGPDFEQFAHGWRTAHRVLGETETSMRAFSRQLVDESEAQRHTSGGPSGPGHGAGSIRATSGEEGHEPGRPAFERIDRLPVVGDTPVPVLPDRSGAETIRPTDRDQLTFERLAQAAPQEIGPTSGDVVGESSVAFDPLIETMRGHLDRDDLRVQRWVY